MKESIMMVVRAYRDFNETGMYMALFYCSLAYLWFKDKNRGICKMWVYPSLIFMALIFNPLVMRYIFDMAFDYASKPRVFWVFPIVCVIAMVATMLIYECKSEKERIIFALLICLVFVLCGKFKYTNEYIVKPTNAYDIPQEAVDIANYALKQYDIPRLVVPIELATAMRIYSSDIRLLYGEDAVYGRIQYMGLMPYGPEKPQRTVYRSMILETPEIAEVIDIIKDFDCNYVVFDRDKQNGYELIEEYGYQYTITIAQYDIYERIDG